MWPRCRGRRLPVKLTTGETVIPATPAADAGTSDSAPGNALDYSMQAIADTNRLLSNEARVQAAAPLSQSNKICGCSRKPCCCLPETESTPASRREPTDQLRPTSYLPRDALFRTRGGRWFRLVPLPDTEGRDDGGRSITENAGPDGNQGVYLAEVPVQERTPPAMPEAPTAKRKVTERAPEAVDQFSGSRQRTSSRPATYIQPIIPLPEGPKHSDQHMEHRSSQRQRVSSGQESPIEGIPPVIQRTPHRDQLEHISTSEPVTSIKSVLPLEESTHCCDQCADHHSSQRERVSSQQESLRERISPVIQGTPHRSQQEHISTSTPQSTESYYSCEPVTSIQFVIPLKEGSQHPDQHTEHRSSQRERASSRRESPRESIPAVVQGTPHHSQLEHISTSRPEETESYYSSEPVTSIQFAIPLTEGARHGDQSTVYRGSQQEQVSSKQESQRESIPSVLQETPRRSKLEHISTSRPETTKGFYSVKSGKPIQSIDPLTEGTQSGDQRAEHRSSQRVRASSRRESPRECIPAVVQGTPHHSQLEHISTSRPEPTENYYSVKSETPKLFVIPLTEDAQYDHQRTEYDSSQWEQISTRQELPRQRSPDRKREPLHHDELGQIITRTPQATESSYSMTEETVPSELRPSLMVGDETFREMCGRRLRTFLEDNSIDLGTPIQGSHAGLDEERFREVCSQRRRSFLVDDATYLKSPMESSHDVIEEENVTEHRPEHHSHRLEQTPPMGNKVVQSSVTNDELHGYCHPKELSDRQEIRETLVQRLLPEIVEASITDHYKILSVHPERHSHRQEQTPRKADMPMQGPRFIMEHEPRGDRQPEELNGHLHMTAGRDALTQSSPHVTGESLTIHHTESPRVSPVQEPRRRMPYIQSPQPVIQDETGSGRKETTLSVTTPSRPGFHRIIVEVPNNDGIADSTWVVTPRTKSVIRIPQVLPVRLRPRRLLDELERFPISTEMPVQVPHEMMEEASMEDLLSERGHLPEKEQSEIGQTILEETDTSQSTEMAQRLSDIMGDEASRDSLHSGEGSVLDEEDSDVLLPVLAERYLSDSTEMPRRVSPRVRYNTSTEFLHSEQASASDEEYTDERQSVSDELDATTQTSQDWLPTPDSTKSYASLGTIREIPTEMEEKFFEGNDVEEVRNQQEQVPTRPEIPVQGIRTETEKEEQRYTAKLLVGSESPSTETPARMSERLETPIQGRHTETEEEERQRYTAKLLVGRESPSTGRVSPSTETPAQMPERLETPMQGRHTETEEEQGYTAKLLVGRESPSTEKPLDMPARLESPVQGIPTESEKEAQNYTAEFSVGLEPPIRKTPVQMPARLETFVQGKHTETEEEKEEEQRYTAKLLIGRESPSTKSPVQMPARIESPVQGRNTETEEEEQRYTAKLLIGLQSPSTKTPVQMPERLESPVQGRRTEIEQEQEEEEQRYTAKLLIGSESPSIKTPVRDVNIATKETTLGERHHELLGDEQDQISATPEELKRIDHSAEERLLEDQTPGKPSDQLQLTTVTSGESKQESHPAEEEEFHTGSTPKKPSDHQ